MNPLISIIIPVYNRGDLISETLDSVIAQEYLNWECIIVDDGSQDQTPSVVESYRLREGRIKFYQRSDKYRKGASGCRNFGLEKASGELIQFLDSDDLLSANKILDQVRAYKPNKLELLTCKWGGFTDSKDLKSRFKYKYHCYRSFRNGIHLLNTFGLFNEFFPLHVYLIPIGLIKIAGIWNDELTNNDDAEFFTRVILNAKRIKFVPEAKVYYRYNSEDKLSEINSAEKIKSLLTSLEIIDREIKIRYKNDHGYYVGRAKDNLYKFLRKNDLGIFGDMESLKVARKDYDTFSYVIRKKIFQYLNN